MINVGVIGCDNLRAAELIRVLVNHPDVELKWALSNSREVQRIDQVVPGIIGDCDLVLNSREASGEGDNDDVDIFFACGPRDEAQRDIDALQLPDRVHVVDLSGSHNLDHGPDRPWKYGMSEMQRRVLVHDAHLVTIPGNAAMASLLALMPMARNLLINSPVSLQVAMGPLAWPCGDTARPLTLDGLDADQWTQQQQQEVSLALTQCQSSFNQPVSLSLSTLAERRTLAVTARLQCGVDSDMIRQLYDQYYSDHNFVFMVDRPIVAADVENTNKCLISLDRDESSGVLTVNAVMDLLLKGCVGTAVHAMNLLFGLHERVGLSLKATGC